MWLNLKVFHVQKWVFLNEDVYLCTYLIKFVVQINSLQYCKYIKFILAVLILKEISHKQTCPEDFFTITSSLSVKTSK